MDDPFKRPVVIPAIFYQDPKAALDWLERAFAFETVMLITDTDGSVAHAEMAFDGGVIMVGGLWADFAKSPSQVAGGNTQSLHVHLKDGIEAHCERARAAGAAIEMEPADQFYGDRTYACRDLEGHRWTFGQTVAVVSREDAEKASGLTIEGWV